MEIIVNELASQRVNPFLADLVQAMQSTAETAQLAEIERCQEDAKAYVERLQSATADDTLALRNDSETDVATIREFAKTLAERVRTETEDRIAQRMELLRQELSERESAIAREVTHVEERVKEYEDEVSVFFVRLLESGADPTEFASLAAHMPNVPDFEHEYAEPRTAPTIQVPQPQVRTPNEQRTEPRPEAAPAPADAVPAPAVRTSARVPLEPGTLSGAGAVRGRYFNEWYGEVERLREIGDDQDAVNLLLDMLAATEAEAQADGSYVAPQPYEALARILHDRGDAESELSILERFYRQERPGGAVAVRLLERYAALKKSTKR